MRRRALLTALAAATGVTGCLGGTAPQTRPASDGTPTDTAPQTPSPAASNSSTESPSNPVRCRGEPVSADRSVSDAPGYDDEIEYYPANATVRYVAARRGDEPAAFETMSFERWGSIECAETGLERVRAVTAERLGTDAFGSGVGQPPGLLPSNSLVVWLDVATRVDGDGAAETPAVPLSELADVAPRSVDATVSLDGDAFSRTVPVFAERVEVGLA